MENVQVLSLDQQDGEDSDGFEEEGDDEDVESCPLLEGETQPISSGAKRKAKSATLIKQAGSRR